MISLATQSVMGAERLVLASLSRSAVLNAQEMQLVSACAPHMDSVEAGQELIELGSFLSRPKLILSGWVGLARLLDDGRRQIVDLNIAGELTGFDLRPFAKAKASYVALTPVRYAEAGELVERVMARPDQHPGLVSGLRAADDDGHSRLYDHVVRAGRMLAHERLAHFTLDLYRRHERIGLCVSQSFAMPLTQEVLGDVLGLSTVHVNRTLQQLRREGLLKTTSGRWQIPSLDLLEVVAGGGTLGQ